MKKNKTFILKNIIGPLKKKGVRFESLWFGSGYFIFSRPKNSICKFKLRGLPEVLFGVWADAESKTYELFGEDFVHIDKFKPSCCAEFTIPEISKLYWDYKKGKITLQEVIMDFVGSDEDDEYYEGENRISPEKFKEYYNEQYLDELFKPSHGYFGREEFKEVKAHLKKVIDILKENPYIEKIFVEDHLPFFRTYAHIEVVYSPETDVLTDEEFDKLHLGLRKFVNTTGEGLDYCVTSICQCTTPEEVAEIVTVDGKIGSLLKKNWKVYK